MPIIRIGSHCPYCQHQLAIDDNGDEDEGEIQTCDHVVYCSLVRNYDPSANDDDLLQRSLMQMSLDKRADNWLDGLIRETSDPPDCDHVVDASIEDEKGDGWKGGVIYAKSIDEFDKAAAPVWQKAQKRAN